MLSPLAGDGGHPEVWAGDVVQGYAGFLDELTQRIAKHPDHECGCPPWTKMCQHDGDEMAVLVLSNLHESAACHEGCPCSRYQGFPFGLDKVSGLDPCPDCGQGPFFLQFAHVGTYPDLDSAKAAFNDQRNLALMGRSDG